ncbi:hypothetical protein [Rhizobium sp. LjRoot254]
MQTLGVAKINPNIKTREISRQTAFLPDGGKPEASNGRYQDRA